MYILIEEREVYCFESSNHYNKEVIMCSSSLSRLHDYCIYTYKLTNFDKIDLQEYNKVDNVFDKYGCELNLIINEIKECWSTPFRAVAHH